MQHDLKYEEIRGSAETPWMYAWCICGRWSYDSAKLHLAPILEQFMLHLNNVQVRQEELDRQDGGVPRVVVGTTQC